MAKITIRIPKSLQVTAQETAELKSVFNADAIRVLRRHGSSVGNDITNVKNGGLGSGSKKAGKKAGKKK